MNVLHIISGGEVGGSKNHLLSLVKNMDSNQCRNIILCFIKGKLYEEAVELGLDIRHVEQKKRMDVSVVNRIKDICEKENINIINCHGGRANFIGWFLKRKYEAVYLTTVHSDYRDDYRGNRYKTLVYSNINKIAMKSFDYYITVSDTFKNMLVDRGFEASKIHVVYNGIDFNKIRENVSKYEVLGRYNIDKAEHYVTMIARFHPVKGHRVFIDACRKVIDEEQDVRFILVGDGDLKEEIKQYTIDLHLEKYVSFVGFQPADEFINISDFTVLTSFTESFPLVILESAAHGKTVISTEVGGIPKLIENGVNGFLIQPGDSLALAARMLEMIRDIEMSAEFGKKLYLKARENYSIENLVRSYLGIYEHVIRK